MTLGALVITAVALFVGLGALYASWRFVRGLPVDRPGETIEQQEHEQGRAREEAERARREELERAEAKGEAVDASRPRRTSASEWVAGAAIALGLVGLAVFLIRELGGR